MASFHNALFLFAFVLVVVGVNSAAFQQSDNKQRPSVWSAKMSVLDMLSLWKKGGNVNTAGVNSAKDMCLPDVLSTNLYTAITFYDGTNQHTETPILIAYRDKVNKRLAADVTLNGTTTSYIFICGESGATRYIFHKATLKCRKDQLTQCLLDPDIFCLPSNSSFAGSFRLGVEPEALNAQRWVYSSRQKAGGVVFVPVNSAPVAFAEETWSSDQQKGASLEALFADAMFSISDPAVFVPPSYCNTGEGEAFDSPEFDITALFERYASFR